jgi:tripeptidyl-peptidase-2
MTNYRVAREWATFSDDDLMNFGVNVYDDGDTLSIVADVGAHGTHVAGIVAAHYPDRPELNGIAPGAQIVSVKIGDTRLDSTSVGTGEFRGLVAVLENDCDLINMSYGGPTEEPNEGRIPDLLSEIVNLHGVIFTLSAGNEGPALTTVGGPGGTTEALIGVGAVLTPGMMEAQYSMRDAYDESHFTWSSRGPAVDGDLGVVISAPGAAFAPVPNWSLQGNMLMQGTSMAAPNTCGGLALLLSALKAEEIGYTPHSVRRAIESTAAEAPTTDRFALGAGMLQVDKAWDHLVAHSGAPDDGVRYEVSIEDADGDRGVYLREPFENDRPLMFRPVVTPLFHEDADNRDKVDFLMRVRLDATADWIDVADSLLLMHGGRSFRARVDPTNLEPGVHFAQILGFDADNPQRGPLFDVPVTVVRTEEIDAESLTWHEQISAGSGEIVRRFIAVPAGATWADLTITRLDDETPRLLMAHMVELIDGKTYDTLQAKEYLWMNDEGEKLVSMPVVGGRTLEVCLAPYWSVLGDGEYDAELTFHALRPSQETVLIDGGNLVHQVHIEAPIRVENISPSASLRSHRRTLRPTEARIRPLSAQRDLFSKARQAHEIVLTYPFKLEDDASITPRPVITDTPEAWEEWESMLWMIFDAHKRRVAAGAGDDKIRLPKGEYVLRLHVRHDDPGMLESIQDLAVMLDRDLPSPIVLGMHADPDDAMKDGAGFGSRELKRAEHAAISIRVPEEMPDFAEAGDRLLGTITYGQRTVRGSGSRPGGWPVVLVVPPASERADDSPSPIDEEVEQDPSVALAEALRDLQIEHLSELHDDPDAFEELAASILEDWPGHLSVLLQRVRAANPEAGDPAGVIAAAEAVIDSIDRDQLAAFYGVNHADDEGPEGERESERMTEQLDALVEALTAKARALQRLAVDSGQTESFDAAMTELARWDDEPGDEHRDLLIDAELIHDRPGNALRLLNERAAEPGADRALLERRLELFEQLGWTHWAERQRRDLLVRFPDRYPPL